MLKKNTKVNASACGFETADNKLLLKTAVSIAPLVSTACHIPEEVNNEAITPKADSFPIADAMNAINNCHGNPSTFVTGSINVPIL